MSWSYSKNSYIDQDHFVQSIIAGLPDRFPPGTDVQVACQHALKGVLFLGLRVNGQKRLQVILIAREDGQWGENTMDIEEIPSDGRCPERILKWFLQGNDAVSANAREYIATCRTLRAQANEKRAKVAVIRHLALGAKVSMPGHAQVFEIYKHYDPGMPRGQCLIRDVDSGVVWRAAYKDLQRHRPSGA